MHLHLHWLIKKFQSCVSQQTNIVETQQNLLAKVKQEGEKFGEDVKHLADFASSQKKFTSWIDLAEQKKKNGLLKPLNLNQAIDLLTDLKVIRLKCFFYFSDINIFDRIGEKKQSQLKKL